jgi:hypothetical protein
MPMTTVQRDISVDSFAPTIVADDLELFALVHHRRVYSTSSDKYQSPFLRLASQHSFHQI